MTRLVALGIWLERFTPPPEVMVVVHFFLSIGWAISLPVAIITGWLWAIAFISACSIYANFGTHFSAFEGAVSALLTKRQDD